MPKIPINKVLSHLTEEEFATLKAITKNDFTLKANPPTLKHTISYINGLKRKTVDITVGKQIYLWKAIAYNLSPYMRDMAAPPLWRAYLTNGDDAVRLDEIARLILEHTPKEYHYGVITRGEKV